MALGEDNAQLLVAKHDREPLPASQQVVGDETVRGRPDHGALLRRGRHASYGEPAVGRHLSRLKADEWGLVGGGAGIFVRYVEYGERQPRWIDAQLAAATQLANAASEVENPDMQLALLRLAG